MDSPPRIRRNVPARRGCDCNRYDCDYDACRQAAAEAPATPKKVVDGSEPPGDPSVPGRARCFANKRMTVTYPTHIDKEAYIKWFCEDIVPTYADEKCKVLFLRLAHESGDQNNPYLHTHVVFDLSHPLISRKDRALDWCVEGEKPLHPNWTYINTVRHWKNAKNYLAKEDPENLDLKDNTQGWKKVIRDAPTARDALDKLDCDLGQVTNVIAAWGVLHIPETAPPLSLDHLLRWQLDVVKIMNKNSKPRPQAAPLLDTAKRGAPGERIPLTGASKYIDMTDTVIHVVRNKKGGAGKTALIKALYYSDKNRFLACQGVPTVRDFATQVTEALATGWNGDTVLFNLTREQADWKFSSTIEAAIDGFVTQVKYQGKTSMFECRNVWIFTNDMPRLKGVSLHRWKIFNVDAELYHKDDDKNYMSWLEPMTIEDALAIYKQEKNERNDRIKKERLATYYDCKPK